MIDQIKNKLRNDRIWLKVYWAGAASGLRWEERSSWGRTWLGIWDLRGIKFLEIVSWGWCGWSKYAEQISLKLCLTILIEDEIHDVRADSGVLRAGAAHQFGHHWSIYAWMVDWVEGLMRPGQCTLRMLRGYTSLLREHREGENRIFWKEEEDFWEKHRRRFTLRALSFLEYSRQLSMKV